MALIRVLQVVGNLRMGGAETMVMNLYKQIDREKIQFDFLIYRDENTFYADLVRSLGGRVIVLDNRCVRNPLRYYVGLRKIVKKYGPYKAIHAHMDSHNAIPMTIARLLGVPIRVSHSHTTLRFLSKNLFRKIYYAISGYLISCNSTRLLSCGIAAGKALYGKKKFEVIYNPIDIDSYVNVDERMIKAFKMDMNICEKKIVVGMIGRLNEEKNHLFALDVAEKLMMTGQDFVMLVAGEGPMRNALEQVIHKKHMEQYVRLLGNRKDIPVFLKCVDVLLMPSLYEGFPVTLIESQTAGIPALISDSITEEADLGFDLLHRCSLHESAELWESKLLSVKKITYVDEAARIEILRKKGFDSKRNVLFYEKLYGA